MEKEVKRETNSIKSPTGIQWNTCGWPLTLDDAWLDIATVSVSGPFHKFSFVFLSESVAHIKQARDLSLNGWKTVIRVQLAAFVSVGGAVEPSRLIPYVCEMFSQSWPDCMFKIWCVFEARLVRNVKLEKVIPYMSKQMIKAVEWSYNILWRLLRKTRDFLNDDCNTFQREAAAIVCRQRMTAAVSHC